MADIINNNDNRELTEEEIKAYQKQIGDCLEASNQLTKNFKLYIGVYGSSKKFQVSHISKEDYELLQDPLKCQNVKSLKEFYNSLGETEDHTSKKAILLTEDNFAMAFHPAVWNVLKFEERIAAMRVAWKKFTGKDVTEFCNSISTTIAYVGSDYQGSLNIGSIIAYAFEYGSWNLLKNLANTTNCLKMNYYFNQSKQKEYNYITDFESFEEMQYVSPLEPIETDVEKMSDDVKAVYYSQLNRREQRKNFLKADYLIIDHSEELKGADAEFKIKIHEIKEKVYPELDDKYAAKKGASIRI